MSRSPILPVTLAAVLALGAGTAAALALGVGLLSVPAAVQAQSAAVAGEVTKVDKAAGRVTLKHAEIPSLDMPPMTMVWRVMDPGMLNDLAAGDRVRFVPAKVNGQYTVTAISKAPQ